MDRSSQTSDSWSLKIIASNREDSKRLRPKPLVDQGIGESKAVAEIIDYPGGLGSLITHEA